MVLNPYRRAPHDEPSDPTEGTATLTEEVLLLALILAVGAGPVLSELLLGTGSPVEVGVGTVAATCALIALVRVVHSARASAPHEPTSED